MNGQDRENADQNFICILLALYLLAGLAFLAFGFRSLHSP
jgi:hypothetical protein